MSKNSFAQLDTVKLELGDGEWIEIKRELSYGDLLSLQDAADTPDGEGRLRFNSRAFYVSRILAWVVAWSLQDDKGPVELTRDAVEALNGEVAGAINKALNAHQENLKN